MTTRSGNSERSTVWRSTFICRCGQYPTASPPSGSLWALRNSYVAGRSDLLGSEVADGLDGALAEPADFLVCILDEDSRIRHFNRACERATGFTSAEVFGRDPRDVVLPPDEAAELVRLLAQLRAHGRPLRRDV